MPFVKRTDSKDSQHPAETHDIFIGRTNELLFFVQNILKPEDPTHNIISISGQGGVGKSTLLTRLISETHAPNFKNYCLTALVDERQTTPTSIMEKFANQLHMEGVFKKSLKLYKDASRKLEADLETVQDAILHRAPDFAGAIVEGVPIVGPVLKEGVRVSSQRFLDKYHVAQMNRDAERLENPVDDLTKAFVTELNHLANTQVAHNFNQASHRQRIILFFDTFEQLATEAIPWLLDYFLPSDISNSVVLVVAGRDPIEQSIPDNFKHWLPYLDEHIIYSISLDGFTLDETRTYLAERKIIDSTDIETIWKLSHGLPLYLGFLTSNPQGKVDPTANVVANFLRWIPEYDTIKRQLALDAALFSRPFNQDDLAAFKYLGENDGSNLYRWLTKQPFVRPQEGRYSYHELARELFSRYLYQRSKKKYYTTRRTLADYYRQQLEELQAEEGQNFYHSTEYLELLQALIYQLFLLPEEVNHITAIEHVLEAYEHTQQPGEIVKMLRELSLEGLSSLASFSSRQVAKNLLQYIQLDPGRELLTVTSSLLKQITIEPSFTTKLLASVYHKRGTAYWKLREYPKAIEEFTRALELDPKSSKTYVNRGYVYRKLREYELALEDLTRALELDPKSPRAYFYRSTVYRERKEYQHAIEDCDRALKLDPKDTWAYVQRGIIYRKLKEYQRAIEDCDRALELDPYYAWAYTSRGLTYLWMKNLDLAVVNYARSWELETTNVTNALMVEWIRVCKEKPDWRMPERLERIAMVDPYHHAAYICRGVAMWLRNYFEIAQTKLEQTILLDSDVWDVFFWKGIIYASLSQEDEAIVAIEKAIEIELPPIMLTTLRWLENDKPSFYQKYVVPLLARYGLIL